MDISNFKEVEVKRPNSIKGLLNNKQLRRTLLFMLGGAVASMAWFYYSEGQHMDAITGTEWFKSGAIGALFGTFISNSPCARGRC